MTPASAAALARWPNVPACYGWLSLDRRGRWRLQGEAVSHAGLKAFLNSNYDCDEGGNYFVQNGPQRVFVELTYTPWVWRLTADNTLESHTGQAAPAAQAIYLDEEGSILIACGEQIGLLDDRDLATLLRQCLHANGQPADEAALLALLDSASAAEPINWCGLQIKFITQAEVARRFGFNPKPQQA